ncbi:hypothetical protein EW093_04985 [Thiospirochaeta perfilievii]|uniref:Uncharacterized protein n=1 Tax=Thiospirochaeta perfilievii TaxID=252967 RepID=A0A5C1QAK2_9SPIO|nr:transposase [Thiospirochaeta perfilievii]QEN04080.1 hypothetical protein EW093_04985 [Thiospirochaeta perfilievii]
MSNNTTDIKFKKDPGTWSLMEKILRDGARKMLQQALENEVAEFLEKHSNSRDENGLKSVVRNGYNPVRDIVTGIGKFEVKTPRIDDRKLPETEDRFTSAILPKYLRKIPRGSSNFCELESFHLFKAELEIIKDREHRFTPFKNTWYYSCRNKDGFPCAVLDDFNLNNKFDLALDIRHYVNRSEPWELRLLSRSNDIKDLPEILKKQLKEYHRFNFVTETPEYAGSSGYIKTLERDIMHPEIIATIKSLCNTLVEVQNV